MSAALQAATLVVRRVTMWTWAPCYCCWFLRWTERLIQETLNLPVRQAIENVQTVAAIGDDAGLAQHAELLRDIGLGPVQDRLEIADAGLAPAQLVQNAEPRLVRQESKKVRYFSVVSIHIYASSKICDQAHILSQLLVRVKPAYSFIYNLTERCSFLHLIILLSRYCSLK